MKDVHVNPRRRPVARRLQNMGWTPDNQLWVSTRGGDVFISPETGVSEKFDNRKIPSRGFGILDVGCVFLLLFLAESALKGRSQHPTKELGRGGKGLGRAWSMTADALFSFE